MNREGLKFCIDGRFERDCREKWRSGEGFDAWILTWG